MLANKKYNITPLHLYKYIKVVNNIQPVMLIITKLLREKFILNMLKKVQNEQIKQIEIMTNDMFGFPTKNKAAKDTDVKIAKEPMVIKKGPLNIKFNFCFKFIFGFF